MLCHEHSVPFQPPSLKNPRLQCPPNCTLKSSFRSPPTRQLSQFPNPFSYTINNHLYHPLPSILPINRSSRHSAGFFTAHCWQNIITCRQGNEEREWDQPDANTEIGCYLRESRDNRCIVDRFRSDKGGGREVPEPDPVV